MNFFWSNNFHVPRRSTDGCARIVPGDYTGPPVPSQSGVISSGAPSSAVVTVSSLALIFWPCLISWPLRYLNLPRDCTNLFCSTISTNQTSSILISSVAASSAFPSSSTIISSSLSSSAAPSTSNSTVSTSVPIILQQTPTAPASVASATPSASDAFSRNFAPATMALAVVLAVAVVAF